MRALMIPHGNRILQDMLVLTVCMYSSCPSNNIVVHVQLILLLLRGLIPSRTHNEASVPTLHT